jgi:DNA invertase Pin-like site-specific DNA recombinase
MEKILIEHHLSYLMDIGYIRISKGSENKENQEEAILKYFHITRKEVKFFSDVITGESPADERPGFIEMKSYMDEDPDGKLYVYEISRLGRDHAETVWLVSQLNKNYPGRKIFSASPMESWMNIENPSIRGLVISIFAWNAERELANLKQRTKDSLSRKKQEIQNQGYFISNSGKKVTKLGRPSTVTISADKILALRDEGLSYQQIADRLGSKKSTVQAIIKRKYQAP